jgi:hypothetical protein
MTDNKPTVIIDDGGLLPSSVKAIVENEIKEHTTVDLLCVTISTKIIAPAKALNASQAEILTAMLKTSAMYAKHVRKPELAAMLDDIVATYEKVIAEGKAGLLAAPGVEVAEINTSTEA